MEILVAVDLRADAATLVRLARPWAERMDATVSLVHADPSRAPAGLLRRGPSLTPEQLVTLREADEEEMRGLLEELPLPLRGRVISTEGDPATILAHLAADCDALVLGTHGRVGLEHAWLGSVAEKVVRTAPGPVFVLRDGAVHRPSRLLLAVDLSTDARPMLGQVAPWADRLDAVVDVVHADEWYAFASGGAPPGLQAAPLGLATEVRGALPVLHEADKKKIEHEAWLTSLLRLLPEARRGRVILAPGAPAAAVTALAPGYDLVVAGTHGRTGIARWWLGSVAERIVRTSPTPVLLLKPPAA